ncbi:M48 family metallopeptidase [Bartonella sp. B41]
MTVYEHPFVFSDRVVPIQVQERKNARRFTLRIDVRSKKIILTMPPAVSLCLAHNFVEKHKSWIEAHFSHIQIPYKNSLLKEGATVPLLGVAHIIKHKKGRGIAEIIAGNMKQKPQIIVYGQLEHLPRRVADVFKKQATLIITPLVAYYADKVGRKVKSICYKDTKSRWGSCSSDGRLSFSWRLIMAPKGIVEYVVAHEVAHLIEMNHGPRFWDLCENLCFESKTYRFWLKKNGYALHAVDFHSSISETGKI